LKFLNKLCKVYNNLLYVLFNEVWKFINNGI
jgi:hypothetical protein